MHVSPFVLPGLMIFCAFLAGVGILFLCVRLIRKQNMPAARGGPAFFRGSTLLLLLLSWPTLIVSLSSFVALGVVSCRVGFYSTTSTPLDSSVIVTDALASDQYDGLVKLSTRNGSVIWTHPIPTVDNSLQDESGNVADELGQVIYVHGLFYKERDQFPSGVISAYRASDGSLLWSAPNLSQQARVQSFPMEVSNNPLVANGMVYVPGISANGDSAIYALRATNGSIAWSVPIPFLPLSQTNIDRSSAFTVGPDLLVALAQDGDIFAWHTSDGSAAWHVTVSALSAKEASGWPAFPPTLLLANQTIYILKNFPPTKTSSSGQSLLIALQARDGQVLWQDIPRPSSGAATLSRFDSSLYLHTQSTLYKLDARNGTLIWQRDLGGYLGGAVPPVEANNVVYVVENASLYALRATNGSQIWSYVFNSSGGSAMHMISPNVLLVTSAPSHYAGLWNFCPGDTEPYHALFAFNAQNGSIYWRYALTF